MTESTQPESLQALLGEARAYVLSFAMITKHPTAPADAHDLVARIDAAIAEMRGEDGEVPQPCKRGGECEFTEDSGRACIKCSEDYPDEPLPRACGEDIGFGMRCLRARGHYGFHTWDPKTLLGEEPVPLRRTDEHRVTEQRGAE
jgi:hypothetical protein